jgi:hypothetical protein
MAVTTRKSSSKQLTPQRRAAEKAEQVAKLLHSFAADLNGLDTRTNKRIEPTPRNWWNLQSGRFKTDPTFADFVAQIQAARKQEG